jgi:hypothetical protein
MGETLGAFEISSGGVCRICRHERLVLLTRTGTCLTCAIDAAEDPDVLGRLKRARLRRPEHSTGRRV